MKTSITLYGIMASKDDCTRRSKMVSVNVKIDAWLKSKENSPKFLWVEAVYTAKYLINRSPLKTLKNNIPNGKEMSPQVITNTFSAKTILY